MKKLTFILLQVLFLNFVYGQCTPNSNYADSSWGIWPDTSTNFVPGYLSTSYSQNIDFKVPSDAGLLDVTYAGLPITSITLDNVNNLPPGLDYVCDNSNCGWNADDLGCAFISGNPSSIGAYDITLDVTVNISLGFLGTLPVPQSFGGYRIIVSSSSTGFSNNDLHIEKAFPNPADNLTVIKYISSSLNKTNLTIMNMLGEVVYTSKQTPKIGQNKLSVSTYNLNNGIYIYSLSDGVNVKTSRLVVNH
jgi:hypothetical protein